MVELVEKLSDWTRRRITCACFVQRPPERRPVPDQSCQRGEASLRMVGRAGRTNFPNFGGQNQTLHRLSMGPPAVPEFTNVTAGRFLVQRQVGRFQKSKIGRASCRERV